MISLAIVEDSVVYRQKLEAFVNTTPDIRCVCGCGNGASALARIPPLAPQIVLMDMQLPDTTGIECITRLGRVLPETQFLVFTVHADADQVFKALQAGASGYLLKRSSPDEILTAVRDLFHGGAPMSSEIARKVVQFFRRPTPEKRPDLSPRQAEIVQLLAEGYVTKEIADRMNLTVETVRSYLKLIYQKLSVRSRTEAVVKYFG